MPKLRSRLKEIVDSRGLSIRQVARDIDYRFESVRQMYNDEMERFPRDLIEKLCAYLNVSPGDLFRLGDNE
ncbi:helix-turn-helix transcriptional regulator [Brevibacillus sp. SYP-B805]|uniref:helix-turn-helix domain-containing protein n=1 Tax=Brevibacillus sp. SYP-B805 TaxID=1578199 RepID=UPI0013EC0B82|nr:helix-turn-helix transcriptional regulator [Brevibacillus sp. SYP-B805]NGQ95477.1 helix-turn-helix transcriptional regulator [Brevibacillus sp. SYP-B805]